MKRRKIICLLISTFFILSLLTISVSADTGPKPSVRVSFENIGDGIYYATLLSKTDSTGPFSVWDGNEDEAWHSGNDRYDESTPEEIWRAFVEYKDKDGYYFLQGTAWEVGKDKELAWTYYPPKSFKVLVYNPENETFLVSDVCEKYAFDSYFTAKIDGESISVRRSYKWGLEVASLLARILITIAIEIGIALAFAFRNKKELLVLVIANTITQIILNVILNIINFNSGQMAFVVGYILLEIAVFVIEAVLYTLLMRRLAEKPKPIWRYPLYALVANLSSFAIGLLIARIIPGIF